MSTPKSRRGRPRKFNRPARTVTLTLPVDVIETLSATDADLGRAVVRLALPLAGRQRAPVAEVATFGARAVIIIPPSSALADFPGVELVPLVDGRALITIDEATSAADLELALADRIAEPSISASDRAVLTGIHQILRQARGERCLTTRRIIVLRLPSERPVSVSSRGR